MEKFPRFLKSTSSRFAKTICFATNPSHQSAEAWQRLHRYPSSPPLGELKPSPSRNRFTAATLPLSREHQPTINTPFPSMSAPAGRRTIPSLFHRIWLPVPTKMLSFPSSPGFMFACVHILLHVPARQILTEPPGFCGSPPSALPTNNFFHHLALFMFFPSSPSSSPQGEAIKRPLPLLIILALRKATGENTERGAHSALVLHVSIA